MAGQRKGGIDPDTGKCQGGAGDAGIPRGVGGGSQGETFPTGSQGLVAVRHIPFYSMCEHHLVPFFGTVDIAYLPHEGRVAGFSKFTQLVERLAHQPQLQERLTAQIAHAVARDLQAEGVLVRMEALQLCMTMRGDMAPGTRTVTSEALGACRKEHELYEQAWLALGGEK